MEMWGATCRKVDTRNRGRGKKVIASILLIAVGLAGTIFGLLLGEFYAAFIRRPAPSEKPIPKWLGRIIFVSVGMWFVYSGITHLLHH
jgi:putative Mn2+ efflux pump MntP